MKWPVGAPRYLTRDTDMNVRYFPTFGAAERYAKRHVEHGNPIEITRGFHTIANVKLDALDRVWVDVVDTEFA